MSYNLPTFLYPTRFLHSSNPCSLHDKGKNICYPTQIAELLNKYFASVGPNIDKKIPKSLIKHFKDFMKKIEGE